MIRKLSLATVGLAALVAAGPANAVVSLSLGSSVTSDTRGAAGATDTTIAFTGSKSDAGNGTGNALAVLGGSYSLQNSLITNSAAPPAGFAGFYLATPDAQATPSTGTATITFNGALQNTGSFSFLWGSPDTFNTFSVTDSTGTYNITGNPGGGNQGESRILTATGIQGLQSISFTSTQRAFEVDTLRLSAAVPEPTTWAMMVLGFGAVGFAARRRSKVAGRVVTA